jgi:hypothetical protein
MWKLFRCCFVFVLSLFSLYLVWGWITIEDVRKYCAVNNLDFETTINQMSGDELDSVSIVAGNNNNQSFSLKTKPPCVHPIARYALPVLWVKAGDKNGMSATSFSVLEPILLLSENMRNAFFCFGLGYLVSLFMLGLRYLRKEDVNKFLLLRPVLGAASATLLFIIIISGGALIWNEVAGVRGLSLGIISLIGAVYCERFKELVGL